MTDRAFLGVFGNRVVADDAGAIAVMLRRLARQADGLLRLELRQQAQRRRVAGQREAPDAQARAVVVQFHDRRAGMVGQRQGQLGTVRPGLPSRYRRPCAPKGACPWPPPGQDGTSAAGPGLSRPRPAGFRHRSVRRGFHPASGQERHRQGLNAGLVFHWYAYRGPDTALDTAMQGGKAVFRQGPKTCPFLTTNRVPALEGVV